MAHLTLEMEQNHITVSVVTSLEVNVSCYEDVCFRSDSGSYSELPDGVYITFPQGEGTGELQEDISKISVSISGRPDWSCLLQKTEVVPGFGDSPVPTWWLHPEGGGCVKKGEKFTVKIDNIHSNDAVGITKMRIYQKTDTEIQKDVNLEIIKCSLAKIKAFGIAVQDYNIGDVVPFCWEIEGMDVYSKVGFKEKEVRSSGGAEASAEAEDCGKAASVDTGGSVLIKEPGQSGIDCKVHNGRFYELSVSNGSTYEVKKTLKPEFTFFESFSVKDGDGAKNTLTLEWKTRNLDGCLLVYGTDIYEADVKGGTMTLEVKGEDEEALFKLQMTEGETKAALPEKSCTYRFPRVVRFNAYSMPDFIPIDYLNDMEMKYRSQNPYTHPDPSPKRVFPVHIEWLSEGAVYCSLSGVSDVSAVSGEITVDLREVPKGPLYAVDKYGFKRGKLNESS